MEPWYAHAIVATRMSFGSHHAVRKHVVVLTAVLALLAPSIFPHVHASHGRRVHGAAAASLAVADICAVDCPVALNAATATDDGQDTDQHSPSSCPLCRAQRDARSSLLPPASGIALPTAGPATFVADAILVTAAAARSVAAPRAPPLAS